MSYNVGDFVIYTYSHGEKSLGRIKSKSPIDNKYFVVFNCNDDWDDYQNYTGQSCDIKELELLTFNNNVDEFLNELAQKVFYKSDSKIV